MLRGRGRGRGRARAREKRREEKRREERVGVLVGCGVTGRGRWGEGRKGQRERARERQKTGTGRQPDRPTRMKTLISPLWRGNCDNYEIITLSSHKYPDRYVPHPPYSQLWSHWSLIDKQLFSYQKIFDLVSIVRSSIDKWSIDSRSSSIECSFILWLYRSSMGWSLLIYMGPLFDHYQWLIVM